MSLRYDGIGTPCPPNRSRDSGGSFEDASGFSEDDTAAIDFTTEISLPSFTRAKPRRAQRTTSFQILEDREDETEEAKGTQKARPMLQKPSIRTSSMFAQPPQRLSRARVSFAPGAMPVPASTTREGQLASREERFSVGIEVTSKDSPTKGAKPLDPDPLKKDRRRKTIYIPPDDTTMPNVFMGVFSPLRDEVASSSALSNIESQIAQKRQGGNPTVASPKRTPPYLRLKPLQEANRAAGKEARMQADEPLAKAKSGRDVQFRKHLTHSASPKRAPLQRSSNPPQETSIHHDIAGRKTGKENIPPGEISTPKLKARKILQHDSPTLGTHPLGERGKLVSGQPLKKMNPELRVSKSGAGRQKSQTTTMENRSIRNRVGSLNPSMENSSAGRKARPPVAKRIPPPNKANTNGRDLKASACPFKPPTSKRGPPRISPPPIGTLRTGQKYPVLLENILNPSMYEERWLEHQEIVLTQLSNSILDASCATQNIVNGDFIRHELLQHYQSPYFTLLYKRVQASLLHGALRIPQDILHRSSRLKDDVGFRRRFLNIWLETYELSSLQAAVETVIGRRIPQSDIQSAKGRRIIQTFLETFLIGNEDAEPPSRTQKDDDFGTNGWGYRRTLLRSVMIIALLDKAKTVPATATVLPSYLFLQKSPYKSSAAVIRALADLMLPVTGDITRPLSHLDCQLKYQQNNLHEYKYRIDNLAVDLRDGIVLTRLVELLLLSSGQLDAASLLTLSTGKEISLSYREDGCPLTRHLKMPCSSKSTKTFNVKLALTALSRVRGIGAAVKEISPADIVDGYREKTIALLWTLVGRWGLSALIDWADVRKEISRLERKCEMQGETQLPGDETFENSNDECALQQALLKKWAHLLAILKGIQLENLTTSFADGRIFESIVDEYEGLIKDPYAMDVSANHNPSFGARLRSLGCSAQFGKDAPLPIMQKGEKTISQLTHSPFFF